jgi:hypothetical protein
MALMPQISIVVPARPKQNRQKQNKVFYLGLLIVGKVMLFVSGDFILLKKAILLLR